MLKKLIIVIGLTLIPCAGGVALAQTPNPTVMYQGHEIEIEPEKGPVQGCVTEVVTTETLDSTTIATKGFIVANNSGKWIVTGIFTDSPIGRAHV